MALVLQLAVWNEANRLPSFDKNESLLHQASSIVQPLTHIGVTGDFRMTLQILLQLRQVGVVTQAMMTSCQKSFGDVLKHIVPHGIHIQWHAVLLHPGTKVVQQSDEFHGAAIVIARGIADEAADVGGIWSQTS